jgi:hypothetical protein
MSSSKFDTLYVGGSSFSEGGGLYQPDIRDLYKEVYDVEWNHFHEVTYGYRVAQELDVDLVMDAKCGGGLERLVRKFQSYVKNKTSKELDRTLFLIEPPTAKGRLDLYSNSEEKYFMVNTNDVKGKWQTEVGISFDYAMGENNDTQNRSESRLRPGVISYLQDFYDIDKYDDKIRGNFMFMISYMLYKKLNFLVLTSSLSGFGRDIRKHLIYDIFEWSKINKLTIKDELKDKSNDEHPGYFGHKEFSEIILNKI